MGQRGQCPQSKNFARPYPPTKYIDLNPKESSKQLTEDNQYQGV